MDPIEISSEESDSDVESKHFESQDLPYSNGDASSQRKILEMPVQSPQLQSLKRTLPHSLSTFKHVPKPANGFNRELVIVPQQEANTHVGSQVAQGNVAQDMLERDAEFFQSNGRTLASSHQPDSSQIDSSSQILHDDSGPNVEFPYVNNGKQRILPKSLSNGQSSSNTQGNGQNSNSLQITSHVVGGNAFHQPGGSHIHNSPQILNNPGEGIYLKDDTGPKVELPCVNNSKQRILPKSLSNGQSSFNTQGNSSSGTRGNGQKNDFQENTSHLVGENAAFTVRSYSQPVTNTAQIASSKSRDDVLMQDKSGTYSVPPPSMAQNKFVNVSQSIGTTNNRSRLGQGEDRHSELDERMIYEQALQKYDAAGTVKQNYASILVKLLRLRQACDHPSLAQKKHSDTVEKHSFDMAKQLPREMLINLLSQLDSLSICGVCSDPPEDAVVTMCGHVFCYQCVSNTLTGDDKQCPQIGCKEMLGTDIVFTQATLRRCISSNSDNGASSWSANIERPSVTQPTFVSSKIKATLEIMNSIISEGSAGTPVKAIVFSQWTGMLDLLEDPLNQFLIQYRRLDGTMSLNARDAAVKDFNTEPEVMVMLTSLKAANLGLNMTAASHVILLDLWWNPSAEDQAVDRAHRIGQTRPVTISRLTISDTVEDRILALQEDKRLMISSAFGGTRGPRLTVDDLRYLFLG